ncbi:uncharacterized protein [Haliotis cracherodii]|uniref:uncharacterized protein n=1 Tax=Haliotis cracherodii TaxID=6455 RepID=UPI0039EB209E
MVTMFLAPSHLALSKSPEKVTNSSIIKKFPVKFWRIVNSCKTGAVCWGFGGNSIRILREKFEEEYLFGENKPFKTATFSSFIRQLNLYGFRKIVRPSIINEHGQKLNTSLVEYKHALFLKGHPELLQRIHRNNNTHNRRKRKNSSGESTRPVLVNISDHRIKEEVIEDGFGGTINQQVIKEEALSAFQDVTNQQDRTSGNMVPSDSVPDQAASPATFPACTGKTLVSVQLPMTKQPMFRQPPSRNVLMLAPVPSGHAANNKPSIQHIAPATINRPNLNNADVPYASQGHTQNTVPQDLIKLDPALNDVKPDIATGRGLHQRCDGLTLVPNYRLSTSDVPIHGLMQGRTHQRSGNINVLYPGKDQKTQAGSCTARTFPIQPRPVQIHLHGLSMTPNVPNPLRGNIFPGNTQRHPVLYMNKTPRVPLAPRSVKNMSRFQRPPPLRPQYTLYNIVKPTVQDTDNSGCGEMASHPLLRPVRQDFAPASVSNTTDSTTYSQYVPKPNLHLQSIPEYTTSTSEQTESNVSLDNDGLADLALFKLSSTLKDIDAPCEDNIEVDDPNSNTHSTRYVINTATSGVTTETSSVPEQKLKIKPSEDTTSAPTRDNDTPGRTEDSKASSPRPATAFWELTTLTPPSTGPKRQLFKESVTRLTIPVSGLPRDLFSVRTAAGEMTDQSDAVITLETSEDGHVTGHLILPGRDAQGTKSTEL